MDCKNLNIYKKMLLATQQINTVAKNLKVDLSKTNSYKAVSEADVIEAVKPIESALGIYSYPLSRTPIIQEFVTKTTQYGDRQELFLRLETVYRFVNTDNPAEFIDITTYGDGVDSQDKAPGKAMTYADKYALLKAYKIQTGEDPDANKSEDLKKPNKAIKPKQWVWPSGRFKGLTAEESYVKPDFTEYITQLKEINKLPDIVAKEIARIEKEYNKISTNPDGSRNLLKEVIVG